MKIDAYETSALMNSAARPAQVFVEGRRADCFEAGDQGGTHCGNPLMAAVGCAVLDVVAQPSFLAGVRERAARMQAVLATHAARIGGDLRSAGLLQALFTADAHGLSPHRLHAAPPSGARHGAAAHRSLHFVLTLPESGP
jgi:acetylornithine/succinyldiaminopimelate/putrescine aminotransferase